jgi:molybdate transport system regulatory protein
MTTPRRRKTATTSPLLVPSWQLSGAGGIRLGEEYVRLLKAIQSKGSLREAATECDISYRTAWTRVNEINGLTGTPLVVATPGGARGGESVLSAEGERLLAVQQRASSLFEQALATAGIDPTDLDSLFKFLRRISMKTTARNQFHATIESIQRDAVEARVALRMRGGAKLVSQVSLGGLETIGAREGAEVIAIIKATWIEVVGDTDEPKVSTGNRLRGKVASITGGAVNAEVALELEGGECMVATVTAASVREMHLAVGGWVWALFQESSVILGTLG